MSQQLEHTTDVPGDARSESGDATARKAYTPPELKRFGPMGQLTKLDPGPVEDFIAYGGAS